MQKHKIIAALVALPAAILLWLYVVTVVSPNSTRIVRDIPVTFEGSILLEERELIMTEGGGTVSLKITGDRVNLNKLTNQNIRVVGNLSQTSITEPGDYTIPLTVIFPDNTGKVGYDFIDKTKADVSISVAKLVTKTVPVVLDTGEGKAKEGFFFDGSNAKAEPSEITISGPDYEVNTVNRAMVDCTDISKLEETVVEQRPILLMQSDGTPANLKITEVGLTEATVSLPIQKYKELKLSVDIRDGGGATSENIESLQFSSDSVLVRGSAAQIDNLEDTLTVGMIELAKTTAGNNSKTFSITLPSGIKNVNGIDEVEVTVKLKGLRTQTYLIFADSVELLHIPQNANVKLNAEKIAVKLRGPEADIALVDADNIHVILDLSGVTESGEVPALVTIEGFPNVAVIEDVYVDITLN